MSLQLSEHPALRGAAAAAALILFVGTASCRREPPPAGASAVREPKAVRAASAIEGRLPRVVAVTGTLAADEDLPAAFKVSGRVSEVAVDLGSTVRKGQILARLDPTDYRIRVDQAEAALRQARAALGLPPEGGGDRVDVEKTALVREARAVLEEARRSRDRMARLLEKDLVARSEFDAAVARHAVAEGRYQAAIEEIRNRQELLAERRSAVMLARQQLADTVLVSPIDGAVRERRAAAGEFVAAGQPVVALVRIHPLRLRVAVPERDAASVRVGQPVRVRVEGDPGEHAGRVVRVSPALDERNRTLQVEAEVANRAGRIRPGSFARAEIVVSPERPAVLVPAAAVVTFAGVERVYTIASGRAVERRIRTGRRAGDRVEVLEGLSAGETVVVEPGNLAGGSPVTVVR